jgi:hypothetical protein
MSAHPWDEWAERRGLVKPCDPPPQWVHPDGCLTPVGDGSRMYPICEHGQRALFVGSRGDGYVLQRESQR